MDSCQWRQCPEAESHTVPWPSVASHCFCRPQGLPLPREGTVALRGSHTCSACTRLGLMDTGGGHRRAKMLPIWGQLNLTFTPATVVACDPGLAAEPP